MQRPGPNFQQDRPDTSRRRPMTREEWMMDNLQREPGYSLPPRTASPPPRLRRSAYPGADPGQPLSMNVPTSQAHASLLERSMDWYDQPMTHHGRHPGGFIPRPDPQPRPQLPQTYNGPSTTSPNVPAPNPTLSDPPTWNWNPINAATPEPPVVELTCVLCCEKFDEDLIPHRCPKCPSVIYCGGCLKDWFLDACRNESKMPPKCCHAIPVSSIAHLLTTEQIGLYKAKFEEWSTPDRLYCPVPTCSTFISPRLYIKPTLLLKKKTENHHVSCPKCGTSVCTKCRNLAHISDCPESDLDPALEEQLKKWKIKRCPKCKTGVRRMYGCAHIECGAHFCWECLYPISECDGSCEDRSENDPESEPEEDDLDGRAGYEEGDEYDFGPEPYGTAVDVWGCHHIWLSVKNRPEDEKLECQRCFRAVRQATTPNAAKTTDNDGDTVMSDDAWQCEGGHHRCHSCRTPPGPFEVPGKSATTSYRCRCGVTYCDICERNETIKELETGYECRCGMLVCGGCKDSWDVDSD
ncbi:uncharacterized protein PAC_10265 [Phialocephala subalpina]|uniref:RBR-type E3 ubiquitin transferase n=1 Tax=Phialocephala subalpina TaxID=576137 RepID=A0A1L7X5S5_9HELO|nr:uncharacterized protein PAC_10265 [Phialocephala subalpina]